jgi:hypothetical protein
MIHFAWLSILLYIEILDLSKRSKQITPKTFKSDHLKINAEWKEPGLLLSDWLHLTPLLPHSSPVVTDKLLTFSESQFPHF